MTPPHVPSLESLSINGGSSFRLPPSPNIPGIQLHDENSRAQPVRRDTRPLKSTDTDVEVTVTYPSNDEHYISLNKLLRRHARKDSAGETFWPMRLLHLILTPKRVHNALTSTECFGIDEQQIDTYCKAIAPDNPSFPGSKYTKIFANLILLGKGKHFSILFQHRISDDCLPLVAIANGDDSGLGLSHEQGIHPFFTQCNWGDPAIDNFVTYQRGLSPQYFGLDKENKAQHFEIRTRTILPWLRTYKEEDAGGYSTVRRYLMDPESHGFHDTLRSITLNGDCVAVKSIKTASHNKNWLDEVKMLRRFSGKDHPHLITLLCSYTMDGTNHLVFPCAKMDLDRYWEEMESPIRGPGHIDVIRMRWVSKQIQGLMEALKFIHDPQKQLLDAENMFGRHGDLKPQNVLWFQSPSDKHGILVITDLGLAEVHRDQSKSNIPNQQVPVTPGYRPPECDIEGGKLSRAFDIWTMGCMLLEKICWLLGGQDMREDFENDRMSVYVTGALTPIFFDIQQIDETRSYVVMVKESVFEWMELLLRSESCTAFIRDLVHLIHDKLIVVLSPSTLRGRAEDILKAVDAIHNSATNEANLDYIRKPVPEKCILPRRLAVEVDLNSTAKTSINNARTRGAAVAKFNGEPGEVSRVSKADFENAQGE
ncbi:kinase-like domain-containing protein [Mariannaea sp. PMI_226]|nr:kinase-like domain-containing protein [Mariannaea sp. PMI_226]